MHFLFAVDNLVRRDSFLCFLGLPRRIRLLRHGSVEVKWWTWCRKAYLFLFQPTFGDRGVPPAIWLTRWNAAGRVTNAWLMFVTRPLSCTLSMLTSACLLLRPLRLHSFGRHVVRIPAVPKAYCSHAAQEEGRLSDCCLEDRPSEKRRKGRV